MPMAPRSSLTVAPSLAVAHNTASSWIGVLEQVKRGQRLGGELVVDRKGPHALDCAQQDRHAVSGGVGHCSTLVDQELQRFSPQVRIQRPRLTTAQLVPAIRPGGTDARPNQILISFERGDQGLRQVQNSDNRAPTQPRRQLFKAIMSVERGRASAPRGARAGPRQR